MSSNPQPTQKKLLYEISIIRPLIIFLLVVMHAHLNVADWFGDGWAYHNDYQTITAYKWFGWLISGFRIETIALVAGYVFAYQSLDLKRSYRFWPFVWKKFKRLIIPMLFFGVIYYFCFIYNQCSEFSVGKFLLQLFSGCGHLWFLPMLFWCFMAIWVIDRIKASSWLTLLLFASISIIPIPRLPLGLARLPHFLFFVYAGYFLWTKRGWLFEHCLGWKWICPLWAFYVVLVVVRRLCLPETSPGMSMVQKMAVYGINGIVKLLMSCFGILALYLTVCKTTTKDGYTPKPWVIAASDSCYGVYVYHQFLLIWLYFFTPLVGTCPRLLVPWIGLLISLGVSLLFTRLSLKTKFGRFLIG